MAFETLFREAYGLTLASWASGKFISAKDTFTLQGNNGGWVTIPSDEYVRHNATGVIVMNDYDDDGNEVDWSAYTSYRATYSLITRTTKAKATFTNEAQTVDYLGYQFDAVDAMTGEVDIAANENLVVQEIFATSGHIAYFSIGETDEYTIEADNGNFRLRSNIPSLELGDATAFGTGIGIWQGKDGSTYKWRVGDPAGEYASWDGSTFSVTGEISADSGDIGGFDIGADYIIDAADSFGLASTVSGSDDVRFYAGAAFASRASAPFRVTQAGAVTASNIDLAGGWVSGTFTVGGTLCSAASPNARYELTSAGLKTYDSGNVQRVQILNDGSGWLGSSSVFSWTAAGVVSLNGSAVVGNSLDAGKVSFTAPTISGLTLINNSPSAGYVAWSSFTLTYQGVSYTVASGNSNSKYIYWKKSVSTTVLQAAASIPANAPDMFIVCVNFSGTAYQSNFAPFIYADYISVGNLSAISADLGTITAGTITGATVRTASSGARTEMNASNLFGLGFGGIGGTDGATTQWYAKATDGKIYAGGGNIVLDASGILNKGSTHLKFQKGATTNPAGYVSFKDGTYTNMFMLEWIQTGGGAVTNSIWVKSDTIGLNIAAGDVLLATASAVTIQTALKFNVDNSWDIGASGANRPRDVYIGGEYRFYSERATVHGIYDRANSDTTVGNTAVETTLYSKSITANDLGTTGGIRVSLYGQWTNSTGANRTLTIRVKFGATTLHSAGLTLTPSGTNGHFETVILLFNTATNAQRVVHRSDFRRGTTFVDTAFNTTLTSAEGTTSNKTLTVTVQWDTASANATLTKKFAFIELMPA